jgi:hypothetical protein
MVEGSHLEYTRITAVWAKVVVLNVYPLATCHPVSGIRDTLSTAMAWLLTGSGAAFRALPT